MSDLNPIIENKEKVVSLDVQTTPYSTAASAYRSGNIVQVGVRFANVPMDTLVAIATNLPIEITTENVYGIYGSGVYDNGDPLKGFVRAAGGSIFILLFTGSSSGNGHATVTYITKQ